mmetsp:Transcript_60189/g.148008  ORF Transcript_60189/g.148008 Transcript_60189/m.148008 type:complete len:200 (-) Transcript_60189:261-860(-)
MPSVEYMTALVWMVTVSRRTWMYFSIRSLMTGASFSLRVWSHERERGVHPRMDPEMKMMPMRDTVAGEAFMRFSGSKTAFISGVIGMRSPLARVSSLLSSSTVLRFSIQMASTGPSSRIHDLLLRALVPLRHSTAKMPSVQSPVVGSSLPNICAAVTALGFILSTVCFSSVTLSAPASTSMAIVLPDPVGPTTPMPWRT